MPHTLTLHDIRCQKGHECLFERVNCALSGGDLLQVAGANGSGKTTLLRVLAGLNSQYDGDVRWNGALLRSDWVAIAPALLYLGHIPALKARLTARENLDWYARCAGATPAQVDVALAELGLQARADLPCHQLSAGQQRRVVLARLWFSPQPLWILDEPFTALDVRGFAPVEARLQHHLAQGGIVVLTTHHGMERLALPHRTLDLDAYAGVPA